MNKVELNKIIDEARYYAQDQMKEPAKILQMIKEIEFLDDFCNDPPNCGLTQDELKILRTNIKARIMQIGGILETYTIFNI